MTGYVYAALDKTVVAVIEGPDNAAIEAAYSKRFGADEYALTYSPAFGASDGLIVSSDTETINA